ncbi:helix-turn-helix domain-containing protein [Rossellomorea vietnamensis]|uniref:helix-turn-helix domain-containing protein n=1 Tax=Rossellomorea vietnamensis TaxID=218284 RepID=UPI001E61FA6A|nr:helix-turn-helix transcriptional regulator [Rossellomorea vietnamensis]MCC5801926.1 helix-turn-helix transcriptional regulator [Rossellomorea vietnamensis]
MSITVTGLVGKKIRHHRRAKEITIQELSRKCGLTVNYISLIEKGEANPSLNKLFAIVCSLEVQWEDIMPTCEEHQHIYNHTIL